MRKMRIKCRRCGRLFTVYADMEEEHCARCRYTLALEARVEELEKRVFYLEGKLLPGRMV